jgi:hypothetical protein
MEAPTAAGGPGLLLEALALPSSSSSSSSSSSRLFQWQCPWQRLLDGLTSSLMALSTVLYTYLLLHASSFGPTTCMAASVVDVDVVLVAGGLAFQGPAAAAHAMLQGALVYSMS